MTMTQLIKNIVATVLFNLCVALPASAYCFYNQTGSDVPVIQVYVYDKLSDAEFGIGFKLASDIVEGAGSVSAISKSLILLKPIGGIYGLINRALFKAKHIIKQGEHACWNWKSTGRESMVFVVIDDDAARRNKLLPLWINQMSTHDGLCFCKKDGLSLVATNNVDERCGNSP